MACYVLWLRQAAPEPAILAGPHVRPERVPASSGTDQAWREGAAEQIAALRAAEEAAAHAEDFGQAQALGEQAEALEARLAAAQ